jgi:uncharacterized hydrophobic protein (TIGR00271 family)
MSKFKRFLNLREGEDNREKTLETVRKNISFKGANLWILACAIIVASVGLNVNSTAVIIGAMLISPLMGPIVGAGFALGIYDFALLKKSLQNLLTATVVSLIASALYFFISPFKEVQSELLARTAPNIYDILIAFFGGIVGAISITRVEKGNPIPGVAIATALMPPLCTAGYGIATGQWHYTLGAFYLYCINCVFIGIATFLIVKYLNYPAKKQVDERQQKQVKIIITIVTTAMLLPGAYLAYSLYREQQFKKNTDLFIQKEFTDKGYVVVYKRSELKTNKKKLELAFLQHKFTRNELDSLKVKINRNTYLKGTDLLIRQDTTDRFTALKGDILNEIRSNDNKIQLRDSRIKQLEEKVASSSVNNIQLFHETKVLFPQVKAISVLQNTSFVTTKDSTFTITTVAFDAEGTIKKDELDKMKQWLTKRLKVNNISLFRKQDD